LFIAQTGVTAMKPATRLAFLCTTLSLVSPALAVEIDGVLPASLDQPRVYVCFVRPGADKPLAAKGASPDAMVDMLVYGKKPKADEPTPETFAVEAFLDTGASGIMLSGQTAKGLGVRRAKFNGKQVVFYDVGVAGREAFDVTEPLTVLTAPYSGLTDGDNFPAYAKANAAAFRVKIHGGGGLLDMLTGGVDVAGMPVMAGKVMLVDARPLSKLDKLKTSIVAPNDKSLPKPDATIKLSYVDYDRFTQLEPAGAPSITTGANPMVGPDPFNPKDATKPVTLSHGKQSTTLSMLLDTGAAASMISSKKAKELGISVDADGNLTNVPARNQFDLPIGGIGGSKTVHGFFVDVLDLPVSAGEPIRYRKVPFLVNDITVTDDKTKETFTLDGVLGMNMLVASASISGGLSADIGDINDGPFDFVVVDNAGKTLRLTLKR
jgi:hypothetical protein